jgi:hypothetical protein
MNLRRNIFFYISLLLALFTSSIASAQALSSDVRDEISDVLTRIVSREVLGGSAKVDRTRSSGDQLEIYASIG